MAVHSREASGGCRCYSSATPSTTAPAGSSSSTRPTRSSPSTNAEMQDGEGARHGRRRGPRGAAARASTQTGSPTRSTSRTPASPTRSRRRRRTSRRCAALGGEAREGTRVEAIEVDGGKVRGVRVGGELHPCDTVVLAAGPWSLALARTAGSSCRSRSRASRTSSSRPRPSRRSRCAVSSQVDRVYLRPAPEHGEGHLLAGRGFPKDYEHVDPDGYDDRGRRRVRGGRRASASRAAAAAGRHAPAGGRVGLYDVTPDWHPILGPVAGLEGLVLARGGSGHCFKLGPAIGELVAARRCTGARRVRVRRRRDFSVTRFAEGRELRSTYGGNRG